jgi:hypothetical protein
MPPAMSVPAASGMSAAPGVQCAEPECVLEVEGQYEQQSELAEGDDQSGDVAAAEAGDREEPQIDDDESPGPKSCPLDEQERAQREQREHERDCGR